MTSKIPMLICLAAVVGSVTAAQAQSGPAQPVLTTHRLSAALANEMVGAAVQTCASQGYPVSAVVVDTDGVRQAQLRGDGAVIHTLNSSYSKAFTAVTYQEDTIRLVDAAKTTPISPANAKLPNLLVAQGGVVIKLGQEVIGAIGVGGGPGQDIDTRCARAGLDKVRDRLH